MDADNIKLAATRMAPLQCMAWGHPVTSGFSTIDVFLSSEWMEPKGAESFYYERLVQLPGLGVTYERPKTPEAGDIRAELGLGDHVLYLCCQSLQKYLPRHDEVFPAIAKQVPEARFAFLQLPGQVSTERFQERLKAAFESRGLDWRRHCVFLPRLSQEQYLRLNGAADVYLDGLSWSGGNTSLEALAYGLPVVTQNGSTLRERHTAAMMWGMDLGEWVADSAEQFVSLAVELGSSSTCRKSVREQILRRNAVLFNQIQAVRGLEDFLEKELGAHAPQRLAGSEDR